MSLVAQDDAGASAILAQNPRWVIFWVVVSVPLYVTGSIHLAASMMPQIREIMAGSNAETAQLSWMILNLPLFGALVHLMLWNESKGMTAFAGRIHIPPGWGYAIMASPILLLSLQLIVPMIFAGGSSDWVYGEDGPPVTMTGAAIGISMVTAIVILAPLSEEILMRGVAMGYLLGRGASPWLSIILTSVIFTALHLQYTWIAMIPVFIMGCYFGWLRVKTGSVVVPILAHIAANGFLMVIQIASLEAGTPPA